MTIIFPWCILEFIHEVPAYTERPFLVAGLVAVYLIEGDEYPSGTTYMGTPGEGAASKDPDHIINDLRPYHVPCQLTFEYLHAAVDIAVHVSSYPRQLLFELPLMGDGEFTKYLTTLPRRFGQMLAYYHNGEFVHYLASRRIKDPVPQLDESGQELIIDDTDYLIASNGGKLHPGVLLECRGENVEGQLIGENASNAGVVVVKDGDMRLTCAMHTFDGVSAKVAYHGESKVGELEQMVGEDIGLIIPVVPVSNEFLGLDCMAKRLIKTTEINDDDIVGVDSCFTGLQRMVFVGTRYGKRNRRTPGPEYPHYYVVLEQGIYTSSDPVIPKPPVVRMGMCGTPLLRLGNTKNDSIRADGDILGFFLWLDESSYKGRMLFSYAQPCDPLVEAGWRIADTDYTGVVEPLVNEAEGAEVES